MLKTSIEIPILRKSFTPVKILEESNKKDAENKRINALKGIIKNWSIYSPYLSIFHREIRKDKVCYNITDGYRWYSLDDHYSYDVYARDSKNDFFNLDAFYNSKEYIKKYIPDKSKLSEEYIDKEQLKLFIEELEDIDTLSFYVIDNRGDNRSLTFNALYLFEFLEVFNTNKIYLSDDTLSPCYYENDDGEMGILQPIKINY